MEPMQTRWCPSACFAGQGRRAEFLTGTLRIIRTIGFGPPFVGIPVWESFAEAEQTYADAGRRESPPESEENIAEAQRSVSTVMRLLRRPLGRLADGDQV